MDIDWLSERDKMPRSKNSVKRPPIDVEALARAIEDVKRNKISINLAAKRHGLSRCTVQRHLRLSAKMGSFKYENRCGHKRVFTDQEEKSLVAYLVLCSKLNYTLSRKSLAKLALEFAKQNGKTIPASWDDKGGAGRQWLIGFVKRHKDKLPALGKSRPTTAKKDAFVQQPEETTRSTQTDDYTSDDDCDVQSESTPRNPEDPLSGNEGDDHFSGLSVLDRILFPDLAESNEDISGERVGDDAPKNIDGDPLQKMDLRDGSSIDETDIPFRGSKCESVTIKVHPFDVVTLDYGRAMPDDASDSISSNSPARRRKRIRRNEEKSEVLQSDPDNVLSC